MKARRSWVPDALHLGALNCLAVQPLFELLAGGPEFFFLHRSQPIDVWILAGLFFVGIPAALLGIEAAAARIAPGARRGLHALFVMGLLTAAALPILQRATDLGPALLLGGALALGALGATVYERSEVVRSALTLVSPAALLAPGLFLFGSPVTRILLAERPAALERSAGAGARANAPVVVLVFDEFSTVSLLDEDRRIDAVRYPHFAALADEATWLRDATTVADMTPAALAAILTGRYPGPSPLSEPANRVRNLFSLLGASHDIHAMELYPYCPDELCQEAASRSGTGTRLGRMIRDAALLELHLLLPAPLRQGLPEISHPVLLLDPGDAAPSPRQDRSQVLAIRQAHHNAPLLARAERFERFLDAIRPGARPGLHFLHVLLPHEPSVHLPSGRLCVSNRYREGIEWESLEDSIRGHQRHLLQVAYVDTLIGRLVARLREQGLYDESLLLITADHGVSHHHPASRRIAGPDNRCEIMSVPLLIKAPGQRRGAVRDRNVETIDILPSIADLLGIGVPWHVDGRSAFDPDAPVRETRTLVGPYYWRNPEGFFDADRRARFPADGLAACPALERKLARFGSGASHGQPFGIGPFGHLVGRPRDDLPLDEDLRVRVEIDRAGAFAQVDPDSRMLPCSVEGRVHAPGDATSMPLAVVVNGAIQAVTRATPATPAGVAAAFSTPIPERALRPGANALEVLGLAGTPDAPRLVRLPGGRAVTYALPPDAAEALITGSDGSRIRVVPGALRGRFERSHDPVRADRPEETQPRAIFASFRGYAVDEAGRVPPETLLVFVAGRFHDALRPGARRPEVAKRYRAPALLHSGFRFSLPLRPGQTARDLDVRVFAVAADGRASEIPRR